MLAGAIYTLTDFFSNYTIFKVKVNYRKAAKKARIGPFLRVLDREEYWNDNWPLGGLLEEMS
jgi:hypothetical protein